MGKNKHKYKNSEVSTPSKDSAVHRKGSFKYGVATFILFCFAAILIYGNSLNSPFIWDDQYLVTDNHFITSFKFLPEIFKNQLYYSTAGTSNFYRPLQTFFLMLDYSSWKTSQAGYHIANILFHILCGFFIYLIIDFLFKRRAVALSVGLLFLVHPVNSTVVNYISSRADSQATLFILISFWLFCKSARNANSTKTNIYFYVGSLISFIFALLSKELSIVLPFLILINRKIIYRDVIGPKVSFYKKTIPFLLILAIYILLRLTILNFSSPNLEAAPPMHIRLLTTAESFIRLIGLLFMPSKIHIEKSIPFSEGLLQPSTLLSLVVFTAILIFMFKMKKRSEICFFGLGWFFVSLMPMANIVPINATIADHWLYLPGFGFLLAMIALVSNLIEKAKEWKLVLTKTALSIYILIIIVFSLLTVKQNTIWKDPLKFYQLALKYSPGSYRAHNEIGVIYLGRGQYDIAIPEFQAAVKLNSKFDQAYDNLGVAYDKSGNLREAVIQHENAIKINPYNAKTYNNLGNAYIKLGQLDKAIEAYNKALKINSTYKAAYNNLGVAYFKQGMYEQARESWQRAIDIDPNFMLASENLKALDQSVGK
jgi:tetratricopeptide (TPR) repeat protein